MSWTAKPRLNPTAPTVKPTGMGKPGPKTAAEPAGNVRVSNGLKEFLWLLDGNSQGRILDLGAVFQTTVMFFIERGFRLSTEDMMRSWKEFLISEEESMRSMKIGDEGARVSQGMLAGKFLDSNLQYPEENFHGVLAWDLFDYLDAELLPRVMERLYTILRPGGAVLASFHSKTPERFNRYKIVDGQSIELIPSPTLAVHSRIFQNREILDIFGKFRSSKTFVGRDQVREALFLK
ncbi:MAG TPA: class I SAM-dependent methyltransferase [Candidatus Acidoferrales bacterium]